MTEEHDRHLDEALRALAREQSPKPRLEERVVASLREQGLIVGRRRRSMPAWLGLTAALGCLGVGWLARGALTAPPALSPAPAKEQVEAGPAYLLLLSPLAEDGDPAAEAALVREYGAWAGRLRSQGRLVSAEKLGREARQLPPAAAEEAPQVSGFFLIRAGTLDEAEAIARDCPHLRHGGTLLVRNIDPT